MPIDASVGDILRDISSESPAPGGGSVAALSGCFGAALISMVCNLSIGKKKYKDVEMELEMVLTEADALRKDLSKLYKEDIDAFNGVMAAYKAPEKEKKNQLLQHAYKKAAYVPFEVVKKCLRIMELAEITTSKGNQQAITDSGVGALMAYSGMKGAVFNVKVNLRYIQDEKFVAKKEGEIEELEKRAEKALRTIRELVEHFISCAQTTPSS